MACEKSSRRFDLEEIDRVSMRFRSEGGCPIVDSVEKIVPVWLDRKKIQTIGTDQILKFLTLCDIALWKCGL